MIRGGVETLDLAACLEQVQRRIGAACARVGRSPADVTLLAVSKTVDARRVAAAADLGIRDFGENYIQEAADKIGLLADRSAIRWHFIGHLQRNKARFLDRGWAMLHSLDSIELARRLGIRPGREQSPLPVLVQVNLGGEMSKTGVQASELNGFVQRAAAVPGIVLSGLMTIPPPVADPEANRPYFRDLRGLRDRLCAAGLVDPASFVHLSMGMSDDFEPAIEEGATIVRVGSALFGSRPLKR